MDPEMQAEAQANGAGHCFCGAVQLQISGKLRTPVNCHCTQCRRLSGAAFTTWFSIKWSNLDVIGAEKLTSYAPTTNLERKFCKVCGSHVFTLDSRLPNIAGVPAGILEGMDLPAPDGDYFVENKAAWFHMAAGHSVAGWYTTRFDHDESASIDPIDAFVGSGNGTYTTDEIMRMTRGEDWNQP